MVCRLLFRFVLFTLVFCSFFSFVFASVGSSYFYVGDSVLLVKHPGVVEPEYLYRDRLGSDMNLKSLPFGQEIESADRFGFTGKERDVSGLHYFAARYYDSSIGRFTSVDPVRSEPSYQFVRNNPLNLVDPSGREPVDTVDFDVTASWSAPLTGYPVDFYYLRVMVVEMDSDGVVTASSDHITVDYEIIEFSSGDGGLNRVRLLPIPVDLLEGLDLVSGNIYLIAQVMGDANTLTGPWSDPSEPWRWEGNSGGPGIPMNIHIGP